MDLEKENDKMKRNRKVLTHNGENFFLIGGLGAGTFALLKANTQTMILLQTLALGVCMVMFFIYQTYRRK
jgi:3-hydroxyisobutyrate dehydrogenase-like beta-hydroxyacid dehydrogenase